MLGRFTSMSHEVPFVPAVCRRCIERAAITAACCGEDRSSCVLSLLVNALVVVVLFDILLLK